MRITREALLKLARNTVDLRTRLDRHLVCVYLTGSLLSNEPLLGGTTDIDLVFVHDSEPPVAREVERVSDEVHLDIAHFSQMVFQHPRSLRLDPWLGGYLIENPVVLYETQHWFEFTQASVAAQFNRPETILGSSVSSFKSELTEHTVSAGIEHTYAPDKRWILEGGYGVTNNLISAKVSWYRKYIELGLNIYPESVFIMQPEFNIHINF